MSDSPVFFKRSSKAKPGQRARQNSPDAYDSTSGFTSQAEDESPITLASKLKNKAKRSKLKSRLSFGGGDDTEGDGEVFQVKKSNLSQKLKLEPRPASPGNLPVSLDQANISNGTPSYSAAYLSELKASTPSSRKAPINDPYDADMSMDVGDISVDSFDVFADNDSGIPSESSILNAKQRRERLRATATSGGADYISLSVIKRNDESKGPHPDSRLVREEDEFGEGEDEFAEFTSAQERIPLGKKSKKAAASKRKETMQEMIEDAAEEDDETIEWEQAQLRRGGHLGGENVDEVVVKPIYRPAPIPTSTPIPTLRPAIARFSQSLAALTTSHASNTSAIASLAEEREQLDQNEKEMREMVRKAEAKRSWFVAFGEWVESVATFLDEKFPQLEKLEDEHVSILKECSYMILQRRRSDDEDDLSLFLGSLPTPPQHGTEELDEPRQTVPRASPTATRHDRMAARAARRSRRRAMQTQIQTAEEGYSTDSSLSPSDNADLTTALSKLSASARAIVSDVRAEAFRNPSLGLGKWFGEWRERYEDVYTGAWGGLGLVGAWEFWVRLEIVCWNPILDSKASLDDFAWYTALYEYSRPPVEEDVRPVLGPDGDLVSAMISTAIVPRLCIVVEGGAFDPYSARDLRRMVDLAEQIETSVEKDNPKFLMLLKSVYKVFASEVSNTESLLAPYLSLNNPPFNPDSILARQRFLARRTKLVQSIIRWRKYTSERLGIGELATRLVNGCIAPVAENGWDVGGDDCVRKVMAILPTELMPAALKGRLQ